MDGWMEYVLFFFSREITYITVKSYNTVLAVSIGLKLIPYRETTDPQ